MRRILYAAYSTSRSMLWSLNWDKLMMICINCNPSIRKLDGCLVRISHSMIYLSGFISDDCATTSDMSRRIGLAYHDFSALQRVWSYASLTCKKTIMIFNACMISRLLYSLDVAWLRQNELCRLDASQALSLRRICRMKHSYYSRISQHASIERNIVYSIRFTACPTSIDALWQHRLQRSYA